MYLELQKRLGARLRAVLKEKYDLELETIPLEIPPELKFGELSTPIAFELARKLRKAPKMIAQEMVAALEQRSTELLRQGDVRGSIAASQRAWVVSRIGRR